MCGYAFLGRTKRGKIKLHVLDYEKRFYQELEPYSPQVCQPPSGDLLTFPMQLLLLYIPFILLTIGFMQILDPLIYVFIPCYIYMIIRGLAGKCVRATTSTAWRLLLSDWIVHRVQFINFIFLGIGIFLIWGACLSPSRLVEIGRTERLQDAAKLIASPSLDDSDKPNATVTLADHVAVLHSLLSSIRVPIDLIILLLKIFRYYFIICILILLVVTAKGFVNWLQTWCLTHPGDHEKLSPPASGEESWIKQKFAQFWLLVLMITAVACNYVHLFLAIDIISMLIRNKSMVSCIFGQALGWMVIDLESAAHGCVGKNAIGIGLLLILALPTFFTVAAWIVLILRRLMEPLRYCRSYPIGDELNSVISDLCLTWAIPRPKFYIIRRGFPQLETRIPWLFGQPVVIISRYIVDNLSQTELVVAISHELSHVKYDRIAIRITRWLSLFSLFPCNVFSLLLNTEGREKRADQMAVRLVGDKKLFINALIKLSIYSMFFHENEKRNEESECSSEQNLGANTPHRKWLSYIIMISALFRPEIIHGYAHPRLSDRFADLTINTED